MATRRVDANDNEQLPFKTISVAAEKIVQRLENDKSDDQKNDDQQSATQEKQDAESHRRYVEQRVRETLMWERRINPKD